MRFDNDMKFTNLTITIISVVGLFLQIINVIWLDNNYVTMFMLGMATFSLTLSIILFIYNCLKIRELKKEYEEIIYERKKLKKK